MEPTNANRFGTDRGRDVARLAADDGALAICWSAGAGPAGPGDPDLAADQRRLGPAATNRIRRLHAKALAPAGRGDRADRLGGVAGGQPDRAQCRRGLGQRLGVRGQPPGAAAAHRRAVRTACAGERQRPDGSDPARRADPQHLGSTRRLRRQHRAGGAVRRVHAGRAEDLRPQDRLPVSRLGQEPPPCARP